MGKWFCGHPNEANSPSRGGRSQLGKLRLLEMSMGVSLLGGKGVREHVVDDKMEPESALPERGREGRDDVWLQSSNFHGGQINIG